MDSALLGTIRGLYTVTGIQIRWGVCTDLKLPPGQFLEPDPDFANRRRRHICEDERRIEIPSFVVFDTIMLLKKPPSPDFRNHHYSEYFDPYVVSSGTVMHAGMVNIDMLHLRQANVAEGIGAMVLYHRVLGSVRCVEVVSGGEDSYQIYWSPELGTLVVDSECSLKSHHRLYVPRDVRWHRPQYADIMP